MLKNKIALVTGGARGIGLEYVKELLRNEIKGVSVVDIKEQLGKEVEESLNKTFGRNKVIFLHADVAQKNQLKDAFESSFKHWNGLDIVINCAGIVNEQGWDKTISVNCGGIVHGTYLGFEYMSKAKGGNGGVIVNMSSTAGTESHFFIPTYSATKSFVIFFSRGLGNKFYFERNRVKVLTVCPGLTDTPMLDDLSTNTLIDLHPDVYSTIQYAIDQYKLQSPEHVAKQVMNLIEKATSGTVWAIENEEPPYEVPHFDRLGQSSKLS